VFAIAALTDGFSEGCPVSEFPQAQQDQVLELFKTFNIYYPEKVLARRLEVFKANLSKTYFAWIGLFGDYDPYYYRIQSPVAYMELDFHCGSKFCSPPPPFLPILRRANHP